MKMQIPKEDSDVDDVDFGNFKGIYAEEQKEKYYDEATGAHFEYYDLCKRLAVLKEKRKIIDQQLGIKYETEPKQIKKIN